ncbi:MAG TPA: HesA/MoeB/ThiF family protein [Patescibacteria group bacterium]|nr:HesA/MoeB/ThiF family protein [Patescibacteria group bacterium]
MAGDRRGVLSEDELEYYSRQMVLKEMGSEGQRRLKESRVCVVGVGGLGSPVTIQLASMGVGFLRIVDRDVVEMSNLQRQHIYGSDRVGYPKVEAAAERLRSLNPFIEVDPVPLSLTPGNAKTLIEGMDVVVDCLDSMSARYSLNRACVALGIPLIHGAVITHVGNVSTIIPGKTACLECFQGGVDDSTLPSCATVGVLPSIIGVVASIQVSEAIRLITGRKPLLANALLFCDLDNLSFEKIRLAQVDSCPVCGSTPRSEPAPVRHDRVEEICGREGRRVFVFTTDEDQGVDLRRLNEGLRGMGYRLEVEAEMGTTFTKGPVRGSVLSSGVTILEGVGDAEEAETLHGKLLKA